jgi:histidinol-phosphate/aromatic aminotransferase/cobyric acid decarboxylase-like protein
MKKLNIETIPSSSNSLMFKVENPDKRRKIFKELEIKKILIKESITPPFQDYMRVSFGTMEQISGVIKVIKENY